MKKKSKKILEVVQHVGSGIKCASNRTSGSGILNYILHIIKHELIIKKHKSKT